MGKMGRPSKAKAERRECVIQVRVTADEKKAVHEAAAKDGKKLSDWARGILLSAVNVVQ